SYSILNAEALRFQCPFVALGIAVSTFDSQNMGANKIDRIKKGLWQGSFIGVLFGISIGILILKSNSLKVFCLAQLRHGESKIIS
ncbi:MAG: hypothetical protein SOX78_08670, partial [Treponema sp.]|nr:hypothetical protein [Treponema sp.]